jgi:hypothetical protein
VSGDPSFLSIPFVASTLVLQADGFTQLDFPLLAMSLLLPVSIGYFLTAAL